MQVKAGKRMVQGDVRLSDCQQIDEYLSNKKLDKDDENQVAIALKVSKFLGRSTCILKNQHFLIVIFRDENCPVQA